MAADPPLDLGRVAALWGSDRFEPALKAELETLPVQQLGLHRLGDQGGLVTGPISVSLIDRAANGTTIRLHIAVLFSETVGGCSCGDEPYQVPSAATLALEIDRGSGLTSIRVV